MQLPFQMNRFRASVKFVQIFFRATALFLSATPTSWTKGHIVPAYARQIHQSLDMGLGVNTMEGREAKQNVLAKFTRNTQFTNRWTQVFRHE